MNRQHLIVMISFAVAFGLVAYFGWAFIIGPINKKIKAKMVEVTEVETKLKDAKSKAAQYDKFKAQAENIRRDLNLITQRLDSNLSLREQNRVASQIFAGNTLLVDSVQTEKRLKSKEPGFGDLDEISYKVAFKGGYHALGNFLNQTISGNRIIVPTIMKLTVGNNGMDIPTIDGTISLSLFLESGGTK